MAFKKGQSGNPKGRPKGSYTKIKSLEDAIKEVEKKRRKTLLIHAIERAYADDKVLIAVLKKILPDMKAIEFSGDAVFDFSFDLKKLSINELRIFRKLLAKVAASGSVD